ncbi:MAG: DNA polymerase I [Anaerolineales bacterium]|nr:DNA polymerase I [Anaerolineales bacterium]
MPPTLYLIDGHALAYRMFFALTRGNPSGFTTREGEPTAGVFGFTSVLLRILEQEKPDYLAVAFDTGKTFRDDLFADYKGTREKMPDDLRSQMGRIKQIVDAFNIPRLEMEGYEADDVLGSAARQAVSQGYGVKIITGDRDLLQLVEERIAVNLPGKTLSDAKDYFPEDVVNYLGVRPDQVVDYKALVGDASDNIPGVMGVGEKTAKSLLGSYDTLDGIYDHLDDLSESVRKKLIAGRESAYLSQKLATIITSLNVNIDMAQAKTERFDPEIIEAIFRELEFRTLLTRLITIEERYGKIRREAEQMDLFSVIDSTEKVYSIRGNSPPQVTIVDTEAKLNNLIDKLNKSELLSFDTETTSTDQMQADLVGISLAVDNDQAYYIPVGHHSHEGNQLPIPQVIDALRVPLTNSKIKKIGHNVKYDFVMLARHGLRVSPLTFDSMIAEWLIEPSSRNLGLKNLAWTRLDYKMTHIEDLIGKGKSQISMANVPIEKAALYAGDDAGVVLQLMPVLFAELEKYKAKELFNTMEMPLVTILADMEMAGIALDTGFLAILSDEMSGRLQELESNIYQTTGSTFNINSPQQLSGVLFDKLMIPPPGRTKRTSTGFYSTSADVLESLRGKHAVVDLVLEYRELAKLKSTYLDALPCQLNPDSGRVHTSYNQTGSVTGRLASSDPNLQNIPIRTDIGRQVRKAFVADPGKVLLSVDYSQVELRIVAHMAQDKAMLDAFRAGEDIHAATAAAVYGKKLAQVNKEQRRHAKAINFGLIYGMSPFGLTRTTELTLAEAEDFVKTYFKQFPGVQSYLTGIKNQAAENGYVETLLGRRRYFPGLKTERNQNIRSREEREAINAPIQGTAADIMKLAMLKIPPAIKKAGFSANMILQVHDELVFECPVNELTEMASLVQQEMENAYTISIPLRTEARFGKNWGELKTITERP